MNMPEMKRKVAITNVLTSSNTISFSADCDLAEHLGRFGKVNPVNDFANNYWICVDARYDLDEVVAYIESLNDIDDHVHFLRNGIPLLSWQKEAVDEWNRFGRKVMKYGITLKPIVAFKIAVVIESFPQQHIVVFDDGRWCGCEIDEVENIVIDEILRREFPGNLVSKRNREQRWQND